MLLIRGRIIDGTGAEPIDHGALLIDDEGRIARIGQSMVEPEDASVLDLTGCTILPGFIDAHVHLVNCREDEVIQPLNSRSISASVLRGARYARDALEHGVTTLRDCGASHHGIFELRALTERGDLPGPRILVAGHAICTTGGHGTTLSVSADGDAAVRAATRAQVGAGADFIKVMLTGGTATRWERTDDVQFTSAELLAIVDEAHRRAKRVAVHCSSLEGARLAVECGVDTIEHGIVLDDEVCNQMADRGIFLITTTALTRLEAESDPLDGRFPFFTRDKAKHACEQQMASLRRAVAAGVQIATGTDANGVAYAFGSSLRAEFDWLQRAGMSILQAIRAGTMGAAAALGRADDLGSLEVGKRADLVAVAGDPIADSAALGRVQRVFMDGTSVYCHADNRDTGSKDA